MPTHPDQDWNAKHLIVHLAASEVEVLEMLLDRLDRLVQIEAIFDDVAFRSPFILGQDMPHVTQEARELIAAIIEPWMPGDGPFEVVEDEADSAA